MMTSTRRAAIGLSIAWSLTAMTLAACSPRPAGGLSDAGATSDAPEPGRDAGSAGRDAGSPAHCTIEPVRSVSQSCCEAYGVDACGAGLFCAAFDERTIGTCYALGSRLGGEECFEGAHCGSGTCGAAGACAALPGEPCTPANGCASPGGARYLCIDAACSRTTGAPGEPCLEPTDCRSSFCVDHACTSGEPFAPCASPTDCASGICHMSQCSSGTTDSSCTSNADCASGHECRSELFGSSCQPATPADCSSDAACPRGGCYESRCIEGGLGADCDSQPDCVESPFFGELRCIEGACLSPRESGAPCAEGTECESGYCYSSGTCA